METQSDNGMYVINRTTKQLFADLQSRVVMEIASQPFRVVGVRLTVDFYRVMAGVEMGASRSKAYEAEVFAFQKKAMIKC